MGNIKNENVEVDVVFSIGEEERYVIVVLEKEDNTVTLYLNMSVDKLELDKNEVLEQFKFESLQQAEEFYINIKSMSAIELLIFKHLRGKTK